MASKPFAGERTRMFSCCTFTTTVAIKATVQVRFPSFPLPSHFNFRRTPVKLFPFLRHAVLDRRKTQTCTSNFKCKSALLVVHHDMILSGQAEGVDRFLQREMPSNPQQALNAQSCQNRFDGRRTLQALTDLLALKLSGENRSEDVRRMTQSCVGGHKSSWTSSPRSSCQLTKSIKQQLGHHTTFKAKPLFDSRDHDLFLRHSPRHRPSPSTGALSHNHDDSK